MSDFKFSNTNGVAAIQKDALPIRRVFGFISGSCNPVRNVHGVVIGFELHLPSHDYKYTFFLSGNNIIVSGVNINADPIDTMTQKVSEIFGL